jgi:hypothetical protein
MLQHAGNVVEDRLHWPLWQMMQSQLHFACVIVQDSPVYSM